VAWCGVRDAIEPGPNAPQVVREIPGFDGEPLVGKGWSEGDDFLTLNVWTPDHEAKGLPVMVFIHGGAWLVGSKDVAVNDGSAFARSGVVCVAINYRMGVEGFLPIPGVTPNLGLHDQIAALHWVRDNIANFGGDPDNVTAFGESAGAMSVADLMASPLAEGLFRRAIVESGHGGMVRTVDVNRRVVRALARLMGVTTDETGFRSREPGDYLPAVEKISLPTFRIDLRDASGHEPGFGLSRFLPVYGDEVLPEPPMEAMKKGAGAGIDLLIGTNTDEMNIYLVPTGVRSKLPGWLAFLALRKVVPRAWSALKAYGLGRKGKMAGEVFGEALTDLVFRLPARRFAAAHQGRTHFYEFDWRSPSYDGRLGACHGMEMPFAFDTVDCCTGTGKFVGENPPRELVDRVHKIWVDFARDGAAPWPEYDAETRQVFLLGSNCTVTDPALPAESL
jgi:para-nitrobenzyl esterase